MGLVLGRKNGDTIILKPPKCERIVIKIIEVKGSIVKLWIDAPPSVIVNRGEIQEAKDAELRGDPNGEDYA